MEGGGLLPFASDDAKITSPYLVSTMSLRTILRNAMKSKEKKEMRTAMSCED